jgi:hypothetical protein
MLNITYRSKLLAETKDNTDALYSNFAAAGPWTLRHPY